MKKSKKKVKEPSVNDFRLPEKLIKEIAKYWSFIGESLLIKKGLYKK